MLPQEVKLTLPVAVSGQSSLFPASPGQERLWFLHQYLPDSSAYHVFRACRLTGPLNVAALEQSLSELIERHEALRTTFTFKDGGVFQAITVKQPAVLSMTDLSSKSDSGRESALIEQLTAEVRRPFQLKLGPLMRPHLFHLGFQQHALLIVFHHIITDGWSARIFCKELSAIYNAKVAGKDSGLEPLPIQYADFAAWQRECLAGESLQEHLGYWRHKFRTVPPALDLPLDHSRPAVESGRGARIRGTLGAELTAALKELAIREKATVFMVLLAGLKVVLHRYSGQADIVVGTPIAGRTREELEGLIGFFVNTLALRTDLSGDPSFLELLARVRETALDAFTHQELPFGKLVEALALPREVNRTALFQVLFVMQNFAAPVLQFADLQVAPIDLESGAAQFDLTLFARPSGQVLGLELEYNSDLFTEARMRSLLDHLSVLLQAAVRRPQDRISELSLLTDAARRQLLVEWNQTSSPFPQECCVHHLFETQAARSPQAVAAIHGDRHLTYAELGTRADELAARLRSLGIGPDVPVGVGLERSVEMLLAVLAVLKAGGAYVPLDPTLPAQRLAFLIADAGCRVVLTQNSLLPIFEPIGRSGREPRVWLALDGKSSDWPTGEAPPRFPVHTPQQLAYVLYTSGSTGQPKGVEMPHAPLVNLLSWQCATSAMQTGHRTLQFASLGFDVSFQEVFSTLVSGGTLVLIDDDTRRDPAALLQALLRDRVERAFLPFVMFERVAEIAGEEKTFPANLKEVLVAGEQLRVGPALREFFKHLPGCRLWNHYGPTEAHVVSAFELEGDPRSWPELPPIGRPIANSQLYLLDPRGQPVPIGVPGELYIGGVCLSRGYRGRPDLTGQRYVARRLDGLEEQRLYRTGDLCRWQANGVIEFLGRLDHQVKVRGFRVELGEIEAALCELPSVREAVVCLRQMGGSEKNLVAYVVTDSTGPKEPSALKAALKLRLPEYMVPAHIEFLSSLPLTPNGKVDRQALPAPSFGTIENKPQATPPRNVLELELTHIWQRILQRKDISSEDNFFDLGGHSLLAARLTSEMEILLGCKVPVATLFQSPTIASLAQRFSESNWKPRWTSLVPLQPSGSHRPLFFAHGWGGDVFCFLDLARLLAPDQPVYGLQAVGLDGKAPRHTSIESMAAHYVSELRQFQPDGPYCLAGYSMGGLVAFEVAQQLYAMGQHVAFLGLLDTKPKAAPWTVYARTLAPYLKQRARSHLQQWREIPVGEQIGFLRLCWKKLAWWINVNRPPSTAIQFEPQVTSQTAPVPGYGDYYWAVASNYRLRRYPGSIDLFLSSNSDRVLFSLWQNLARGGARLHPLAGKHFDIVFDPACLHALSDRFRKVLAQAQSK
jgi:amino acid adenylation domain-containing protein